MNIIQIWLTRKLVVLMSKNNIYNKDVVEFMKSTSQKYDLIIADPPYNQKIDSWDSFSEKDYWIFMNEWIEEALKKLNVGGSFYIFNNPRNSALTIPILEKNGMIFKNWITWYKKDGFGAPKTYFRTKQETILFFTKGKSPIFFNYNDVREPYHSTERIKAAKKNGILKNGKRWFPNENGALRSDVWEFSSHRHKIKINGKTQKHWHPTPKPHDLIEVIIKTSANSNSYILDLFSGSGSASIVSKRMNFNSDGVEFDVNYCKKIKKELKNV